MYRVVAKNMSILWNTGTTDKTSQKSENKILSNACWKDHVTGITSEPTTEIESRVDTLPKKPYKRNPSNQSYQDYNSQEKYQHITLSYQMQKTRPQYYGAEEK